MTLERESNESCVNEMVVSGWVKDGAGEEKKRARQEGKGRQTKSNNKMPTPAGKMDGGGDEGKSKLSLVSN
jgi:hypothetical protein